MLLESMYPILIHSIIGSLPPIFFAGVSSFIAAVILAVYLLWTGEFRKHIPRYAYGYVLMVVINIVVISQIFVFYGAMYTSPVNVGLLLRFELVTSFIVGAFFLKDRLNTSELLGVFLIILGTLSVLYNGSFAMNHGDIFIVIATCFFPIGNTFAKKALNHMSPMMLLCLRFILGGTILLFLSYMYEQPVRSIDTRSLVLLFVFSIGILIISKACFYQGLRRLQLTNTIFIVVAGATALTIFFSYIFLGQVPTNYQWIGTMFMSAGMYCMMKKTTLSTEEVHAV